MWARFWFSVPAKRPPPPPPFTPPPPPPAPPKYGPLPEPSSVASLYDLAGNFLDRAKTVLDTTGGQAGLDAISSTSGARRAAAELTAPASDAAPAATKSDSWTLSSRAVHWIIVGAVVAAVLLVLCMVACFVRRRRRRRRRRPVVLAPPQLPLPAPMVYHKDGPTWPVLQQAPSEHYFAQQQRPTPPQTSGTFSDAGSENRLHSVDIVTELPTGGSHSYEQLAAATDGFAPGNIIGQGGFGCVYRGRLDGAEVAVKKLKMESRQGDREFRAEVEIISRVHHRNLVTLIGCCIYSDERLLVYEFVPNKTLDSHLHGHNGPPLDWHQRWKIAVGSARGLAYLHDDCYPKIIHRDVKASNILLDHNFEPKVADFGLAKYQPGDHTHVSTRIMGTFGYIAPEFLSSGKLTDKADVFSFGVVLLELITGRLPVQSSQSYMDDTLVGWARPLIQQVAEDGSLQTLVDPRLGSDYDPSIMMRMVECAAAAVRQSALQRPSMVQILKYLQGETRADDLSGVFKITTVEESYSSIMESGESVGPRPRRTQRSQGNTSNDYNSEQAPGDKPNWSTGSVW
ncbi:proline-rich receptor-like protein kinase PERK15 [Miscanthus floridulus]|uniref:proline-rich receptor-like protein kinase PERK15 n=1 Tax=Miscanthus floridulus TaxID=154761 RepID=UPI003459D659